MRANEPVPQGAAQKQQAPEMVLAVEREKLFECGAGFQGFQGVGKTDFPERVARSAAFYPRPEMEEDPSYKQIIPYIVVAQGKKALLLRRHSTQGEARLHNLWSIGVGGHVNPVDEGAPDDGESPLMAGAKREFFEEMNYNGMFDPEPVGYINDDSVPVGQVHFGAVFLLRLKPGEEIEVAEKDKMSGQFKGVEEIRAVSSQMETWSQLILDEVERRIKG